MSINTKYHLLSDLIATLEADGFVVGTGKHLQVQELMSKLPDDLPLESLKTLLCPVFANNRQDQERFYELFDVSLKRVKALEQPAEKVLARGSKDVEIWRNAVLALFVLLAGWAGYILDWNVFKWWGNPTFLLMFALMAGAAYFAAQAFPRWWQRVIYFSLLLIVVVSGNFLKRILLPSVQVKTEYVTFNPQPGSTTTLPVPLENDARLIRVTLCDGSKADTIGTLGSFFVDSLGNVTIIAKDSFNVAIRDTICVLAEYELVQDTTFFVALYQPPKPVEPKPEPEQPQAARLDTMPIPFPRDIAELQIDPEQQAKAEFYQRNAWWIKLLIIGLFGAILISLAQWREKKRRRLVAQLEQRDKPPYIWNIQSDQADELIFGDSARIVLNQLRRRRLDDAYRLDIDRTVEATVRSAGRIDFQFKQQTSPPDYLLLIDRYGLNDHRAELFDHLYQAFKVNEVNVVRFFYQGDPRLCFNRRYPGGLNIKELQHRFGEARLLIVGNGYELLGPGTGRLSKWATIFTNWRERALFTPKPIASWDRREIYLGEHFYLMPASIESLGAALEEFGSNEPRNPGELIPKLEDVQWRSIEIEGDLISTLRKYYDERMVQWIAACAVYPQLQWNITLFLGREFSSDHDSLLTFENLQKISQLPWFVEGKIPDPAREELLDYLEKQGLEQRIRQRLHWLFEHAPKPSNESVAFDEYRINTMGNEWRFTEDRRRRRELEEELSRYYAAGHNLDTVVFKKIEQERNRLDFEAPDKWKPYLFNHGDSFFGLKDWVWAAPLWVLLSMVVLFFNPKYELCRGEIFSYQDKQLCLTRTTDYLLYYEYLIRDEIFNQNFEAADSLLNYARQNHYTTGRMEMDPAANSETPLTEAMRSETVDTVPFLRNLAVYYYNTGVGYYNDWLIQRDLLVNELFSQETVPQQQELQNIGVPGEGPRAQLLRQTLDSLAAISCTNFRRGSQLYISATKGMGYDFQLAMQKICSEAPVDTLVEETFRGQVRDVDSNRPIANVTIKALNGNISVQTNSQGNYQLTLPTEFRDSSIRVTFTAEGYVDHTIDLLIDDPLSTVSLEKLQKPESIEIYTSDRGMKGLRTNTGRAILPAIYNQIELDPASGLYRVQIISKSGTQMGYMNNRGETLIPVEFRLLGFLRDGLIVAAKERYGYLDRNGNIAISFIYEGASDFSKGEAEVIQVLEGQRFTFIINKNGRCIRSCPPESAYIVAPKTAETVKISENIEPIDLFFANDSPDPGTRATTTKVTYSEIYAQLMSQIQDYYPEDFRQQKISVGREQVDAFFSREVQGGYERFDEALGTVYNYLQNSKGQVEISLKGYISGTGNTTYNQFLSSRRMSAVRNSIEQFNNGVLQPYISSGRIKISQERVSESQAKDIFKTAGDLQKLTTLMEGRVEVVIRFAN